MQVVFGEDDKALQVLTPLIGVIPEALLNAVIFHLQQGKRYLYTYLFTYLISPGLRLA